MSDDKESLLTFPCEFPIKIMGTVDGEMRGAVENAVEARSIETVSITERPSRGGNYVAVTLTVRVESREDLDNLYRDIGALDAVRVVL